LSRRRFTGRETWVSISSWLLPFDGVLCDLIGRLVQIIYWWDRVHGREQYVCSSRVWNQIRAVSGSYTYLSRNRSVLRFVYGLHIRQTYTSPSSRAD
jgi:hypothetical protein